MAATIQGIAQEIYRASARAARALARPVRRFRERDRLQGLQPIEPLWPVGPVPLFVPVRALPESSRRRGANACRAPRLTARAYWMRCHRHRAVDPGHDWQV